MTGEVVLREPTAADAGALGRMHHAAWRATYGAMLPASFFDDWDEAASVAGWERTLAEERVAGEAYLVAFTDDGEVAGWAHSGPPPTDEGIEPARAVRLHGLYVAASQQGGGLAARLFDAVLGERPAEVWLIDGNARAEAFYRRRGFTRDGASGPHLATGLPGVRMVR